VSTKQGYLYAFNNDTNTQSKTTFLDVSDSVATRAESGLLGFDFHPEFEKNGYVYVYYIAKNDTIRSKVSRYEVEKGDSTKVKTSSEKVILDFVQPSYRHNGGKLTFGPEGFLYISFGDGLGVGRDRLRNGQDRTTIFGSVIRINVDETEAGLAYSIPESNPFVGETCDSEPCREEIYAYGLRNPWRFSFDSKNGRLWLGDVGHNNYEEVNVVKKGGNYGWPIMEGDECHEYVENCDQSGLIDPVFAYPHGMNGSITGSITGGLVYRGSDVTAEQGNYIFSDYLQEIMTVCFIR
jgi:glucose/arabinose dehydrogenase